MGFPFAVTKREFEWYCGGLGRVSKNFSLISHGKLNEQKAMHLVVRGYIGRFFAEVNMM